MKVYLFIFLSLALLMPSSSFAGSNETPLMEGEIEATLKEGIRLTLSTDYKAGELVFKQFIKKHPNLPSGYFFMAGRFAENITLYHDWSFYDDFEEYARLTIEKASAEIRKNPANPNPYFYIGNIYGYYGLLHGQRQKNFRAFLNAVKTVDNLDKALKLNPSLYDSYYALGTIYYYASKKLVEEGGMTGWVIKKFITKGKDRKEEGLKMLRQAVEHGKITSYYARAVLVWIAILEKDYDKAVHFANILAEKYPNDKRPYWALGRINLLTWHCEDALKNFESITSIIEKETLDIEDFPEVKNAIGISKICLGINRLSPKRIKESTSRLKNDVKKDRIVWLEYSNAKGVRESFLSTLTELQECGAKRASDKSYRCRE